MTRAKFGYGICVGLVCCGCSGERPEDEALGTTQQALQGTLVPAAGHTIGYVRTDNLSSVVYNNHIQQLRQLLKSSGGTWSVSTLATNMAPGAHPTAIAGHDGWNRIAYRAPGDQLFTVAISSTGQAQPPTLLVSSGAIYNPSAYVGFSSIQHVTYVHTSGHLYDMSYNPSTGAVTTVDVSTASGAPLVLVNGVGPSAFYNAGSPRNEIVFRGPLGHYYRHVQYPGDPWSPAVNVTQGCGVPVGNGRPSALRADGTSTIFFRGTDAHVWVSRPDVSSCTDLTALCGGPTLMTDPVGYVRNDGKLAAVYRGNNGKVHQVTVVGGTCTNQNVQFNTGAANPTLDQITAYVRSDNANAVLYTAGDQHRWELSQAVAPGSPWVATDLTAAAGGVK